MVVRKGDYGWYYGDDLGDLDELQKRLAQFSRILGVAMKERKQRASSSCA
jgi:hypothetical protein